ncbi:CPBP family intramembrane metalloprotease domain-containing protein [Caulobacter zeae]|uniref:CPBP family intramembrane metalloprotease domain-containing protein n=1 Tax=Caulobacter zeae TaxID=2055137 RepID=A0A2N5DBN2_9CAUL|nr:CPBP family intramembrane glutamic endopeptidase [Caulobacter zeae]PLR23473.1 CPBP family intramembrane metalloprotease domain-containing protein [Caulobacter zeae]
MGGVEVFAPRAARSRRTWTFAALVLIVVFFVVGQLAIIFGVLKPMGFHKADLDTQWRPLAIYLAGGGVTMVLIFAWTLLFERRPPAALGFNAKMVGRYLRGLVVGGLLLGAVVGVIFAAGGYKAAGSLSLGLLTPAVLTPFLALFAGYVIQGAAEETMFRGWLMSLVASRHGLIVAVLLNSGFFTLLHASNVDPSKELVLGLFNLFLFAVVLSLYAAKEGSLWGACAFHTAWNALLGAGFGLEVSGMKVAITPVVVGLAPASGAPWWLTGGSFGPEASVAATIVLAAGCVYLIAKGALTEAANRSPLS